MLLSGADWFFSSAAFLRVWNQKKHKNIFHITLFLKKIMTDNNNSTEQKGQSEEETFIFEWNHHGTKWMTYNHKTQLLLNEAKRNGKTTADIGSHTVDFEKSRQSNNSDAKKTRKVRWTVNPYAGHPNSCSFGEKCFRSEMDHLKSLWHPPSLPIHRGDILPIHKHAYDGDLEDVTKLIKSDNALIDSHSPVFYWTPVVFAIAGGQVEVVKFLVDSGCNLNVKPFSSSRIQMELIVFAQECENSKKEIIALLKQKRDEEIME